MIDRLVLSGIELFKLLRVVLGVIYSHLPLGDILAFTSTQAEWARNDRHHALIGVPLIDPTIMMAGNDGVDAVSWVLVASRVVSTSFLNISRSYCPDCAVLVSIGGAVTRIYEATEVAHMIALAGNSGALGSC